MIYTCVYNIYYMYSMYKIGIFYPPRGNIAPFKRGQAAMVPVGLEYTPSTASGCTSVSWKKETNGEDSLVEFC